MEVFCTLVTLVLLFNTALLVGIASFLVRVSGRGAADRAEADWTNIIRQRRVLQMKDDGDAPPNWDGIPRSAKNWDGIPSEE